MFEIFLYILSGFFLRIIFAIFGASVEKVDYFRDRINSFVFYYIIPFVCLKTTYTMPFSTSHLKIAFVANLTILSCVFLAWFIYRKIYTKEIKSEVLGALIVCSSFGNVLYIGLPILTKLYGTEGMGYAFTYDFFGSTPLTWTVAVAVCMKYGKAKSIRIWDSFKTVLKIPPIWGLLAGFLLREFNFPMPMELINTVGIISGYIIALMLAIVGFSIKIVTPERIVLLLPAIIIKVIVSAMLALICGKMFGLSGVPLNVCMIEAAMPSMLLSMIFATAFGIDMRTSIEMIFLTTIFSLLIVGFFV
ncbi:AEC family transporter [Thermodesulfovibrio hydrogeniphilus]